MDNSLDINNTGDLSEPQSGNAGLEDQKPFRSRFRAWIRVVAMAVVFVFVPEQVSWAVNYNPFVLWKEKARHYVAPTATKAAALEHSSPRCRRTRRL